jgi:Zn-dependent protease with chaperone function
VCAAQVAVAGDPTARRLAVAGGMLSLLPWIAVGGVGASTLLALFRPLATFAAMGVSAGAAAAGLLCGGRVAWWAGVAADAVCVRTTRHPEALAAALAELAAWNGRQVPVRARLRLLWVPVDAWWAVPVGPRWTASTSVNGRPTSRRTAEQQSDVRLLLRAAAVRRLGAGEPATLAAYRTVAAHLARAGSDAAAGRSTDVDGWSVGLAGATRRRRRPRR